MGNYCAKADLAALGTYTTNKITIKSLGKKSLHHHMHETSAVVINNYGELGQNPMCQSTPTQLLIKLRHRTNTGL